VGFIALRCVLAAAVAGLLASEVPLTRKHLRVVEYVLFLGVTLVLIASQYFVSLDLIQKLSLQSVALSLQSNDLLFYLGILLLAHGQRANHVAQCSADCANQCSCTATAGSGSVGSQNFHKLAAGFQCHIHNM
jgi:hypothetical protein